MEPGRNEIAAMPDPVLRNLWITQRYHELAVALQGAGVTPDATWCTFAVWASKTAGAVIRGDDLPDLIRQLIADQDRRRVDPVHRAASGIARATGLFGERQLARFVELISADVAGYIAEGNVAVFSELAAPFEALVEKWPDGADAAFAAAQAAMPSGASGQALGEAFAAYHRALSADPLSADRPPLLLAGNVLAVAHEQQRLQPAISGALDAAVHDTLYKVIEERFFCHVPGPFHWPLDWLVALLADILQPVCRVAITETMLQLVTADERLDLRSDVPALEGEMWPPELAVLGSEAAAFSRWDRTRGTGRPTGATDWTVMDQRMNYIVNLFRSRQRHPALLDPPFSAAQLADLRAGRRPAEPL